MCDRQPTTSRGKIPSPESTTPFIITTPPPPLNPHNAFPKHICHYYIMSTKPSSRIRHMCEPITIPVQCKLTAASDLNYFDGLQLQLRAAPTPPTARQRSSDPLLSPPPPSSDNNTGTPASIDHHNTIPSSIIPDRNHPQWHRSATVSQRRPLLPPLLRLSKPGTASISWRRPQRSRQTVQQPPHQRRLLPTTTAPSTTIATSSRDGDWSTRRNCCARQSLPAR